MTPRKSLIQRRFWLRKELLRRLESAAKANDRSLADEFAERLERSFEREKWQQERENWIVAIRKALENHPGAAETVVKTLEPNAPTPQDALQKIDDQAEREAWKDLKSDLRKQD